VFKIKRSFAFLFFCTSCDQVEVIEDPIPLIEFAAWSPADRHEDPFPEHRPESALACDAYGVREEGAALEVDTGECPYAVLKWPLRGQVLAGDTIEVELTHGSLIHIEPAVAHICLSVGSEILWEAEVAIPSQPARIWAQVEAQHWWPAGTPVVMHLHNHGANNWKFTTLNRLAKETPQ